MAKTYRYDPWRFLKIGTLVLFGIAAVSTLVFYLLGIYYGKSWSLLDCLFMTVITLSTIGYGDWLGIHDTPLAKVYTMILGLAGIGVPAFIISTMTALIVEGVVGDTMRRRRMQQEIASLQGHYIVCGAGGVGQHCIQEFLKMGCKIVVIDRNKERLDGLQGDLGEFPFLVGSAEHDETLLAAGIARAEGLVACLTEDRDNLFITLSAKVLNPDLKIASKGLDDNVRKKMFIAGANAVISPTAIGGLRLVSELIRPATVSFLDSMMRERTAVRFGELVVARTSGLLGKTLAEADLRHRADVLVVAARHPGVESFIYNPKAEFLMEANCVIVVLGAVAEIDKLKPMFSGTA